MKRGALRMGGPQVPVFPVTLIRLLLLVLVGAPAFGLIVLALGMGGFGAGEGLVFSAVLRETLWESALFLAGIAAVCTVFGVLPAWFVSHYALPGRRVLDVLLVLPLSVPTYLAAFIAVEFFDFFGPGGQLYRALGGQGALPIRSLPAAVLVMASVLYPYVYLPCRLAFSHSGRNLLDAARLLGAGGGRLFFSVAVPLAAPAITGGLVLAVIEALNDVGAVEHLGVASVSLAARDLWLNRGNLAGAAQLALLTIAFIGVLRVLAPGLRQQTQRPGPPVQLQRVRGPRAVLVWGVILLPLLAGFVLPVGYLLVLLVQNPPASLVPFWRAGTGSFLLAGGVALATGGLASAFALTLRVLPTRGWALRLVLFGYAVPGTLLALALFPLFRALDSVVAITGTFVPLVLALSVRFTGIAATQTCQALAHLPQTMDWAGRLNGASGLWLAIRVHWPMMRPGLWSGMILVFLDAVKELPASLLLRPLNFETLATRAYGLASAGMFERAALEALVTIALGAVVAGMLRARAL